MRRWQWLAGSVLTLAGLVGGLVHAAAHESAPAPRVVQIENDTPEVRELMRRRSEAVDPVAWMIRMATGVPIEEKEIAPGVFVSAEVRKFDDFTVVWRLAPGVDTSAVRLYRSSTASRATVSAAEIAGANGRATRDWPAVDDAGVAARPANRAQGALGTGWLEVRAPVIVQSTAYTVTNTNDSGAGSLRQAMIDANAAVGGAHVITISATGTINLLSALPQIVNISVSINGPGAASLTINRSSGGSYSIFATPNILYTQAYGFSGIRIQNGAATFSGGGLSITGGTLTINQCVIADSNGASSGGGLGVASTAATITSTTFSDNSATLQGSAINAQGATLTVSNTTISGNRATATNGNGGAIFHFSNGQSMTLTNVTFSGNTSASTFGGGVALISQNPGSYRNTIFSGQSPQISGGGASSLGNNICSDGSGSLSAAGDLPNSNPRLSALGSYGGQTPTHALLPGSPAINAGTTTGAPSADQRGISRVGNVDIGSFESRGFSIARTSGNAQTAAVNTAFAAPLVATVSSSASEPVQGGVVSFIAPASGASAALGSASATIAANGQASTTATANGTIGSYNVGASAAGASGGPLSYALTNRALSADLQITKTDGATTETPGTQVTYTITASNAGGDPVTGATVTDTFPATLSACTWTCAGAGGGTCAASGSGNISQPVNLPVGGSVTFTATCTIAPGATGTLANTATISSSADDPTPANNSATDTNSLTPQADLGITKTDGLTSVNAGSNTTYTIVASNAGPSTVTGATVADTFPAACASVNWTCTGAGGGSCAASGSGNLSQSVNLPPGGSVTFSAVCAVNAAATGSLGNTATVSVPGGTADTNSANNSATDTTTVVLLVNADLAISKADDVSAETPGSVATWRIVASNAGPTAAPGASVTDTFPAGVSACSWLCIAGAGANCPAGGTGNINATIDLPVGGSVTFHATCLIDAGASGTLANSAIIAVPAGGSDPNPANNSASDSDTLDGVLPARTPANWSLVSSGTPSARIQHGMAHDPVSGQTLLFGGAGGSFFNDLYRYQLSSGWTPVDVGVTRPGGRRGFCFAAGNGSFYLYGGVFGEGSYSDFWRYTPGSGWTQLDPGAAPGPTHPGTRLHSAALFDPVRNRFVFFGGRRTGVPTNETWAFQFPGNTWVQLDAGGAGSAVPAARENHTFVYDPDLDAYLLFGGMRNGGTGDPHYNDVWLYTPGSGWSLRDPGGVAGPDRPTRRVTAAMAYDPVRQRHILHGGSDIITSTQVWHNNTWEYDAAANRWREMQILTPMPTLAASAGIAFDTTINRIVIANGRDTANVGRSETYELGIGAPPELRVADASMVEGNAGTTTLNFTVALDVPANSGGVVFDVATQDIDATASSDYVARALTGQTIAQGQSSATFAVTVNGDTTLEGDETLRVVVSNVTGATLADGEAIGTIRSDDFRVLRLVDSGQVNCSDAGADTGTVSAARPDPEAVGYNEQDCTRGASAADALGRMAKIGDSSARGRDYTKIANDGSELPASATQGPNPGDWGCTRDNLTGLTWELKVNDAASLRHVGHRYTWYEADPRINGGDPGSVGTAGTCNSTLAQCNTSAYRDAINALSGPARLCGASDWRLPTPVEMRSLVDSGFDRSTPPIDIFWFPNENGAGYWTDTSFAFIPSGAWSVSFIAGALTPNPKSNVDAVRLVRGAP